MILNLCKFLCLTLAATAPAWAALYDVAADFGSSNPSGAWSYGYASPGDIGSLNTAFTYLPTYVANCLTGGAGQYLDCWQGASSVVNPSASFSNGTVSYTQGYVNMHPDSDGTLSIVAFTAPISATYTFTGEFKDQDTAGGSGVDLAVVLGTGSYLLGPATQSATFSPVAINFAQTLSAGDSVYFVVGANGEYIYDSVGLSLQASDGLSGVPEPSTVVLTAIGFAFVATLRRRV